MAGRAALVLASVLFGLIVLELGCRLVRGPTWLLHWPNLVLEERRATRSNGGGRLIHDDRLGFVNHPGYAKDGVTYDDHGYRLTPTAGAAALAEPPILVVGDSYAHGDELGDGETWAALLQPLAGRHVVNAGVSGYGLDQAVLRAELAAADLHPAAIVLAFIADDLRRSEMKRVWGAEKPYFELVDGTLMERNVPVPLPPDPADTLDVWQRLFGWSMLVDTVLRHQGWQYEWALDHARVLPRGEGEKLACPLLDRLARLGLPGLVVAEYDPYAWRDADYRREQQRLSGKVLACARQAGFATLDLFNATDAAVRQHGYGGVFRSSHPGPVGAEVAAREIAATLERDHIPPR
ncbi:GDSL-like Lipase/Acylhydrolase family [Enhydrobacter aerosaccus]|uniref:GDSL-like Lipase/Acylhydrolase family n=1 Tax=Enhydrobacter aerosaccus TaxID=225324 RepID=A0A1T4M2X6_9HYPH|nr:GDSL-type esterase/lipase family protein [Enhydrobacter aerosaccus]SJZ61292.1 GDSL-like Lipase/Acylhydrolase family [Enhydrobacter aerosaccus]